jgi:hypothetical protein
VSIDDFGAGFTSLAYLSSLAVGELKLDRALIAALASEGRQRDVELVRTTTAPGHALRLRVVAEGIEDRATLDLVAELGCDLAQGYFIGKPRPARELALGASPATTPAAHGADAARDHRTQRAAPATVLTMQGPAGTASGRTSKQRKIALPGLTLQLPQTVPPRSASSPSAVGEHTHDTNRRRRGAGR